MLRLDKVIKPWKESAALNDHISLYGFWNETAFLTKSGDVGMILSVPGVDYESLDRSEQEYAIKRLEAALKAFGPGFHVYQYLFKSNRPDIPFATYDDPIVEAATLRRKGQHPLFGLVFLPLSAHESHRFLIVQRRLATLRAAAPEVDSGSIEQQVKAIRTALGRIKTIKSKLTELGACSDVIDEQADRPRDEIKEALSSIEDSMRSANCKKPPLGSVTLAAEAVATN
jgi:type IV secretory pathway VirB4 component